MNQLIPIFTIQKFPALDRNFETKLIYTETEIIYTETEIIYKETELIYTETMS